MTTSITLLFHCLLFSITAGAIPTGRNRINSDCNQADYIIVGGGPAGLVLAEQLSLNPHVSVILLEAGPDGSEEPKINTPFYGPQNIKPVPDQYVWNFTSQPDPNLNGRTPTLEQGHAWGGGSAVNYMAYCRGAPSVFNEWAEIASDPELRWDALLADFEATTHYEAAPSEYDIVANTSVYGDGPLSVSFSAEDNGWSSHYVEALKAGLGLPEADLNDGSALGVTFGTNTIKTSNRTRSYALTAYGWQMAGRPNVQMIPNAWVSNIGFECKRAVNVTYLSTVDNQTYTLDASEIIVSAGAINSPKLLLQSGVGPKAHLEANGIPVILDAPQVGARMYDHHFSAIEVEVASDVQTNFQLLGDTAIAAQAKAEYKANSTGPLGDSPGGSFAIARIPDEVFDGLNDTHYASLPTDRGQLLYQYTTAAFVAGSPNVSIISAFVALVQPEEPGYIRLNSSEFRDAPLIYSNYYGSAADKAAILYGYKELRKILHAEELAHIVIKEVFPGANVTSDEDLFGAIQKSAQSFHHPLGTVALGKVLDSDWRIRGLDGIRVVDSSTFPSPPTCHLQASVYAYAHRVARKIRKTDPAYR